MAPFQRDLSLYRKTEAQEGAHGARLERLQAQTHQGPPPSAEALISDFGPLNCERRRHCCFKPLELW